MDDLTRLSAMGFLKFVFEEEVENFELLLQSLA